ncbi:MAG TPA: hypothetical protein VMC06_08075 [Opitutaceae bacterium]|nr:hypothetical protein [Opitutaceae bacterium]
MNILRIPGLRYFLAPITALLVIAGASLHGETAEAKPAPAAEGQAATPGAKPAKKGIYVGMPAAELQALIGKPEKIVPVPNNNGTENGHGEVWVYRRLIKSSTEVVTIGSKPVMGRRQTGNGTWSDVVLSTEPVTKNRLTQVYQVASFLIVNGQFVTNKQSEETEQSFQ